MTDFLFVLHALSTGYRNTINLKNCTLLVFVGEPFLCVFLKYTVFLSVKLKIIRKTGASLCLMTTYNLGVSIKR